MRRRGRTGKEKNNPKDGEAARKHIHKAYTSYDVAGYMAKKYNIKEEVKP